MTRTAYAETPPRVVYALTPLGEGLRDVLEAMREWGDSVPEENIAEEPVEHGVAGAERMQLPECPLKQQALRRKE